MLAGLVSGVGGGSVYPCRDGEQGTLFSVKGLRMGAFANVCVACGEVKGMETGVRHSWGQRSGVRGMPC